jgi:hypothetical protein
LLQETDVRGASIWPESNGQHISHLFGPEFSPQIKAQANQIGQKRDHPKIKRAQPPKSVRKNRQHSQIPGVVIAVTAGGAGMGVVGAPPSSEQDSICK